jgi:DNA-binding transcriptional LysR family regulator
VDRACGDAEPAQLGMGDQESLVGGDRGDRAVRLATPYRPFLGWNWSHGSQRPVGGCNRPRRGCAGTRGRYGAAVEVGGGGGPVGVEVGGGAGSGGGGGGGAGPRLGWGGARPGWGGAAPGPDGVRRRRARYAWRIEPDLQQLRSFIAVAEELHFGNAALRLGLSQPQVSRHVANFERELGVTLFTRTPRSTTLTDAGSELLADARETIASMQRLQRRAAQVARGGLGAVTVGFVWSTLSGYLAPLVSAAGDSRRHIDVSVSHLRFTDLVPALRRGDVDLLITRALGAKTEFVIDTLNRERTVVAIPERHPLARLDVLLPGDLAGAPFVTLGPDVLPGLFEASRARLLDQGIVPSANRHAGSPSHALALVAAGVGIYYSLPASAVLPHAGVVYREVQGMTIRTLLARRPEPPSPAVKAVAKLITELFTDAHDASNDAAGRLEAGPVGN